MPSNQQKLSVTPRGTARYPWLTKPDTKYSAEGVYKVQLVLDGADAAALRDEIDAAIERSVAEAQEQVAGKRNRKGKPIVVEAADPPYTVETADNTDTPTGRIFFSFKVPAVGRSSKTGETWSNRPRIVDANNRPCPPALYIGGGSVIRVAYAMSPWFRATDNAAGVSLRLRQVKLLKLVEPGDASAVFGDDDYDDDYYDASRMSASAFGDEDDAAHADDADRGDATSF